MAHKMNNSNEFIAVGIWRLPIYRPTNGLSLFQLCGNTLKFFQKTHLGEKNENVCQFI